MFLAALGLRYGYAYAQEGDMRGHSPPWLSFSQKGKLGGHYLSSLVMVSSVLVVSLFGSRGGQGVSPTPSWRSRKGESYGGAQRSYLLPLPAYSSTGLLKS
jgi:hypothetical protein